MTLLTPATLALVALSSLCSCGQSGGASIDFRHTRDDKGTAVASFGKDKITAEELQKRFAEMTPYIRARYQTLEQKKEYVEGLARFELIANEAVRRGLANDPVVVEAAKRVMVERMLRLELEEKPTPAPDQAVSEYYAKHQGDYQKPEMIRLTHLFLAAPVADPQRAAKAAKAKALLEKAKALPAMDFQAFGLLVRESSEEPRTKPLDGDMRYLSSQDLAEKYGAPVAEAAKALVQVGQVGADVVATDQGFHILKLQGRQAALNLQLPQVKTQIQNILIHEQKMQNYNALVERLKKESGFQIDAQALAKIAIDLKAPATDSKDPQAGFLPSPTPTPGARPPTE